ncbi:ABC transporter substrate-binding protein [Arcanobacterium hippocoleae]
MPKITVGLTYIPDVQFAPLYIAEAKGYFQDAGLDVKLRHHGAQEALLGALQSGTEDIVFAGGDEMMQGRSTGIKVVNWATMYQKYPVVLIAPKSAGITKWEDLTGKKVGLPGPYGENYYGLLAALEIHNLQDKVQIEFIGYTQTAALQEKRSTQLSDSQTMIRLR